MTKAAEPDESAGERSRCKWCRRVLPPQTIGRPRTFCSQSCRQWHWVGKQRANELQLSERELIVTKDELDGLHDELYVLACAVNDAERDLKEAGAGITSRELHDVIEWLLAAARPLRRQEGPRHHPLWLRAGSVSIH